MKAVVLQARRPGGPWGTVNRFVAENQIAQSMRDSEHAVARERLLDHAAECARRYGVEMLAGREFRAVEIDHVHERVPG